MTARVLIATLPAFGVANVLFAKWMLETAGYAVDAILRLWGV